MRICIFISGLKGLKLMVLWNCHLRQLLLFLYLFVDYKAILSKGKVRCAGTSLFLKNRFGIGYHLK